MLSALWFLQFQSVKNRLWQRIKRLRRPRYLFGALAGGTYLALMFGRTFSTLGRQGAAPTTGLLPGMDETGWEFVAALALFVGLVLAWVVPHERAALVFSEAEIAFLFPAPIRRQTLIHYKLVRSQAAVLFTVIFLTLLSRWSGGTAGALRRAMGWWLLLSTINLHLLGSSFARTIFIERGITVWRRRAVVIALAVAVIGAASWWTSHDVPAPKDANLFTLGTMAAYLEQVARSAPAVVLFAPLRWVVRPFLTSGNAFEFMRALGPALAVLGLHYLWVVRADVAFEEASLETSKHHAARTTALREGRWQNIRPARRRSDPFRLSPTGPPAIAILWKNLLSAGQLFNVRVGLALLLWSFAMGSGLGLGAGRMLWPQMLGIVAGVVALWSVVLGPQFVRQDFRQDLAAADLLKMYPLPGWQVALGELLAPALILTVVQWVLIGLAATLLHGGSSEGWSDDTAYGLHQTPVVLAFSAAIVVGPLNLVSLLIPNAAALLMPAWFAGPTSGGATRGIEVMGQRLIFLLAQFAALAVAMVPAALAGFIVYALVSGPATLPAAALVAAAVFAAEAAGGLALLGYWFEGFDLSQETPP